MPVTPKIFISFSSADLSFGTRLYSDLTKAGIIVFQFHESATPGQTVWSEVFANIKDADIYMYLASKSAVKSKPVRKELEFANYQNVNADKPAILLPLVLEQGLRLPDEIVSNNFIPFDDYSQGIQHLFKFLNIQSPQPAQQMPPRIAPRPAVRTTASPIGQRPVRDDALGQTISRFKAPANYQTGLSNPAVNRRGSFGEFGKYALIVCLIGLAGIIVGSLANTLLLPHITVESITSLVADWVYKWAWITWTSKIAFWLITAKFVYDIADDEFPIDGIDYSLVTAKGMGVALVAGLIWSSLFLQVTGGSFSFLLITILVATITLLIYAFLDVF